MRKGKLRVQEWRGNKIAQIWRHEKWWGAKWNICNANSGKGNANNGTSSQTDYNSTTNDISTKETAKGVKVGNTTNDIAIRETAKGIELGS